MNINRTLLALCALLPALAAHAELRDVGAGGFTTVHSAEVGTSPQETWRVLTAGIGQWWNPDHSWSKDAANLYLDARPGGCFCERLADGGFAEHLRVVFLVPGQELRLEGALGPLGQMGLAGSMTWSIEATEAGSRVHFTYTVHGWLKDGFEGLAPAVDGVVGEQLGRLAAQLGSG